MKKVSPKKAIGQHFLKDMSVARQIAATMADCRHLPLLEVGPGTGNLTRFLLEEGHDLTTIEIDLRSIAYLQEHYPCLEKRIVYGDFLRYPLSDLFSGDFCVIGNYPYHISSQIFFRVLEYKEHIPCCSGMVQKEVGERLAARPGGKTYGVISVLFQAWYDVELLFTVPPVAFDPPPKVNSAVIKARRNSRVRLDCNEQLFRTVVKTAFNQRRKTIRNSLRSLLGKDFTEYGLPVFDLRPERLGVEEFIYLTNLLANHINP